MLCLRGRIERVEILADENAFMGRFKEAVSPDFVVRGATPRGRHCGTVRHAANSRR